MKAPQNTVNNSQMTSHTGRPTSPSTESSSTSSSSSSADKRRTAFDFPLPTTINSNKSLVKNANDIIPPPLINFNDNDSNEEEEDDTSASLFSKRNATPAALHHLKNIDNIIQGDQTSRTRTIVQHTSSHGTKDLPIEYDDDSMSQSVSHSKISSVDDITVDKGSTTSPNIDFLEDF